MIKFNKEEPKKYSVMKDDVEIIKLELVPSSITNKFYIITEFIEKMATYHGDNFDKWFSKLITKYVNNTENHYTILLNNVEYFIKFVDEYIDSQQIDFSQFVDESKAKKSSILFKSDEIERIIRLSGYLKLYSVFSNSYNLKLPNNLHKQLYNVITERTIDSEIIYKIYNIIKTKTFRYNLTDRYMWDYIKMIQCKTIEVHVIEIFNFIMSNILVLCDGRNPITYFVGVIDESVKWFLRSVYKGSIIYDDSISTEDIHGLNVDNLKTYSYNDTLGRLKGIAFEQIYNKLEQETELKFKDKQDDVEDKSLIEFQNRVTQVEFISPLCECLVFPVLSRLTEVPFAHFKTLSAEHSAVLSVYTYNLLDRVFMGEYKNLFSLLEYHPLINPSLTTTYKIKAVTDSINFQNETSDFFGFKTKILPHRALCHFVGRISRVNFCHTVTGRRLGGIPLSKVEADAIKFYITFFANGFEKQFKEMQRILDNDF